MRHRKQTGTIVAFSGRWYVRYYQTELKDGVLKRKRMSHVLGPVTTRGKTAPANIKVEAERYMLTVRGRELSSDPSAASSIALIDFVEKNYLPHIEKNQRPSTLKGYKDIWKHHLKPILAREHVVLKNVRTYHVQQWLDRIGEQGLSRNSLRHIKAVISGIFTFAARQQYIGEENRNPAQKTVINDKAPESQETHAYSLDEAETMLRLFPEPAATVFAVACYAGLRLGEIQGLDWPDWREDADSPYGALWISRSVWNGHVGKPKTKKSRAPVPCIPQLAKRLAMYKTSCGNPVDGPMFANTRGGRLNLNNLLARVMLPALNRCKVCGRTEGASHLRQQDDPQEQLHKYERDTSIPEWHGWHAARRGLATNLYHLGAKDKVIQKILRHSDVAVTMDYYVKPMDADMIEAMGKLEQNLVDRTTAQSLRDSDRTVKPTSGAKPESIN